MPTAYKWHPITDFEVDPASLTTGELGPLARVWATQKKDLIERGAPDEFEKRLRREWAIETGIIENVYTLDRGVTRTLIEKGIDAALIPHGASDMDGVAVARIIQDHYEALDGMFDFVGGLRELSTGYIKELHAALLRNQETYAVVDQFGKKFDKPLEKGQYKRTPNSPTRPDGSVHEYCPPEHVASEMDRLIELHARHESKNVPVEVEAAWLHHRFAQIHPFSDGNGRVARAIASLSFIKAGWFPLVVKRDDWARYIDALENADVGDLRPLIGMFVESQRNAVIQATEIAFEVNAPTTAEQAVAAVRERLMHKGALPPKEWLAAKQNTVRLMQLANDEFQKTAMLLQRELTAARTSFGFGTRQRSAIIEPLEGEIIKKAGHVAAPSEHFSVIELELKAGRSDKLVLMSFALGPQYRGILVILPYLMVQGVDPTLINTDVFQVNYEEDLANAEKRFKPWLNHIIVEGLNQWRRTL